MKRNVIAVLFSLVSLLTVSCSKMDMLFSNGEPVTEHRNVNEHFDRITIYNNVNVKLVHDSQPHLELTCPKNLIENISTEVKDNTLTIKNENNFNWLRSFDYSIDLTVYYDSLYRVQFASIGQLTCADSIRGSRVLQLDSITIDNDTIYSHPYSFVLSMIEGSGEIDLTFSLDVLKTVFINGTSTVTLRGLTGYAEHYLNQGSYGAIRAEEMSTNIVKVQSQSSNDVYVWARYQLIAELSNIGNVYYKGQPWIAEKCTSDGRVIKIE